MKLYFARHGESEANVQQVFWNQPGGYGLTDKGREQAATLADNLAGIVFSALYCSPVLRAVQTAQIVGRRLGLAPEVADGLREWYTGILEEATHVRQSAGLFDLGHMGRVRVTGPDAEAFLQKLQTADAAAIPKGGIRYAMILDADGFTQTCSLPI